MPPSRLLLREDYDAAQLRTLSRKSQDNRQTRRLLALAAVYGGMSREAAEEVGGMDRQTLRDWAHRFNAEGPVGLMDRRPPRRRRLTEGQMQALGAIVEAGPDPAVDGIVRWRRCDLQRVIEERFGVRYSERSITDLLKALSSSYICGRPKHPKQDTDVLGAFKKNFPRILDAHIGHLPKAKREHIEVWFQDEARIGQKNGRTRIWAKQGTRLSLPADQRYGNAYLYGAICPKRGVGAGAGLVLPHVNTEAMQMHLDEISRHVAPRAHGVVLMDRAGCHTTNKLCVPDNLTIILLPSRSPELNPVENVWQYLRQNWLSNRVFATYDDIIDAACDAWNNLIARPNAIISIGS